MVVASASILLHVRLRVFAEGKPMKYSVRCIFHFFGASLLAEGEVRSWAISVQL
jgi:hypothetical protein